MGNKFSRQQQRRPGRHAATSVSDGTTGARRVGFLNFVRRHPLFSIGSMMTLGLGVSHYKFREALEALGNPAGIVSPSQLFYWRVIFGRTRSRFTGKLLDQTLPTWARRPVYEAGCYWLGIDISEIRYPLESYRSIGDFFCRSLIEGARPIADTLPTSLVSPCDGTCTAIGMVPNGKGERDDGRSGGITSTSTEELFTAILASQKTDNEGRKTVDPSSKIQPEEGPFPSATSSSNIRLPQVTVKGTTYLLDHFLGEDPRSSTPPSSPTTSVSKDLMYCVLYLGPRDYHQFHSPCDLMITAARHFPGDLLPVNPKLLNRLNDVFAVNERVLVKGQWPGGGMWFTAVGAYAVGNIKLAFDKRLTTNRYRTHQVYLGGEAFSTTYKNPIDIAKGEKLGEFRLGSSLVLIFEAPENWQFSVAPGDTLKVGQRLGCVGRGETPSTQSEDETERCETSPPPRSTT